MSDSVRQDHYAHWFFLIGAAGYGWQLHGIWIGLAVLVVVYAGIAISNLVLMTKVSDPFKFLRINRWAWVIAAWIVLFISGAEVVAI